MLFLAAALPGQADIEDRAWVFSEAGNALGWSARGYFSATGVVAGYWWGETSGTLSYLLSADYLGIPAQPNQYLQVKMRLRLTTSPTDRFGETDAKIYFGTNANPAQSEDRMIPFKTFGNGAWKVYNVRAGNHAQWTGTIRRLRIDPLAKSGARVEIAWIKIMRDTDQPVFCAENRWTYSDGQTTNDSTPTLHVMHYYDLVSGIQRAEFYHRPGTSTSEADWVLDGTDSDAADGGYQHTYSTLQDGTYDLAVKVYDNSGNAGWWTDGDDRWIDDLRIDSGLGTSIEVDAASVTASVPKAIFGNNILWYQWSDKYNASTGRLTDTLENLIQTMGITSLRYATGDTFYWKLSIGPLDQRPSMYDHDPTNWRGPAKFGLDECLRWCEARGIEPLMTIRFRWPGGPPAPTFDEPNPYPQALADAVDLVEYCNSPNDGSNPNGGTDWAAVRAANGRPEPYNVKLFEIGNEPWGYDIYGSPGLYGFDGPSEYSVWFLKYIEGMTAVDPSIKVSVTSQTPCQLDFDPASTDWARLVYEQTGSYVDYAQIHPYLPYSAWQTDLVKLYDETMATPKALDDVLGTHRSTIRLAAPEKAGTMKVRLTEWNINYNWIYDPSQGRINTYHSKTLKAAIATADAFRVFVESGDFVESAQFWSLYKNGPWSCIPGDTTLVYPVYHVFRIFNRHFGDNLLQSKVIGSPTFDYVWSPGSILKSQRDLAYLTAIAGKSADGSALYLVVVNKDRLTAHSSTVNLANFLGTPSGYLAAEIWELNGPSVDDYSDLSTVKITESSATYPQTFTYSFPAHSVTSFKFVETARPVETAGALKAVEDGTLAQVADKVVTAVFQPNVVYVEEQDRSSGIRVVADSVSVSEGELVTVTGRMRTNSDGERYLKATSITPNGTESAVSVALINQAIGGSDWEYDPSTGTGQRGVMDERIDWNGESWVPTPVYASGLNNIGLLVTTCGRVSAKGSDYLYVDDGSYLRDGTQTEGQDNFGVRVICDPADYEVGDYLVVTGISSCFQAPSGLARRILTRGAGDVLKVYP